MGKTVLMQGNEACVEGAIAAGMRFYAGYPITPSTEIAENSAVRLPQVGGKFIQMEDEISSMAAVIGASAAGVKAMTASSGPGFSLKQENLGYACIAEIPCVIVDVQRSGPSTGLPTSPSQADVMQSRWGTHGDHPMIVISPSSVRETYDLAIRCFNLAEKYRTPVIFLMDEIVGHLREGIEIPDPKSLEIINRPVRRYAKQNGLPYHVEEGKYVPEMLPFGQGQRYHITGLAHNESGFPTNDNKEAGKLFRRLLDKVKNNRDDIVQVEEVMCEDADAVVVCFGGTARAAVTAVKQARNRGIKAGMFRPITIWPFPDKELEALSKKVKRIVVAEHNDGQILLEVQRIVKDNCEVDFIGRIDGSVMTPREILSKIEGAK
ncbi:2-oxoglutarate ferredoxin oxidoreductase subunit alpha [Lachnospiraceae bacterium XBB1006]|nr:2-oxoglutarate ferredoxin oxidoreductase subunit alpha [Lachnospiraceae bacterium XBB1006]